MIKIITSTYKIKVIDLEKKPGFIPKKDTTIYGAWHQRFFPAISFFAKNKPIAVIISLSNDGELISRIVKALGWHPVRGSSSKGGKKALNDIILLAHSGYNIGHAVDGPQGPFGIVKPGIIKIAQLTSADIVPVIISPNNYWIFNSWDHFILPKPFAKIIIRFTTPHKVPRFMNKNEFEKRRLGLEKKIYGLQKDTDLIWNQPKR